MANDMNDMADPLDELAAFGHPTGPAAAARTLTDLVERNPVSAVLVAAAAGAGLMALVSLMARRDPDPLAPVPLVASRGIGGIDFDALKQQIADLAERLKRATSVDAAKERVEHAGVRVADGWGTLRAQALDALGRFEPEAGAAIKAVRENPVWTALIVGAVGALVASQLLGKPEGVSIEPQSDPSADA